MELVCPAGNFQSLKAAVDHGADAVYIGLQNDTNARHFPGLNFQQHNIHTAIDYARNKNCRVFLAINTFAQSDHWHDWKFAVDAGLEAKVCALIIADIGILDYARGKSDLVKLHLSVQASASNASTLAFYQQQFQISRAVLPRVLSLAQVKQLAKDSTVDLEVFGFGSLCIMAEGRCFLSSYITGESPNTCGACSPAKYVEWTQKNKLLESRLNGKLIDRFGANENAGYPTLCKGRFQVGEKIYHALEAPTSLNTLDLLAELFTHNIKAIKIEGRQRSPAYIAKVTSIWRAAIDRVKLDPEQFVADPGWHQTLSELSEGSQTTLGAYERVWH